MSTREIVHIRAKDFQTAVYVTVGLRENTRYLVQTGNLCPDCASPMLVLDSGECDGEAGALRAYHDIDRSRVAETRRRYLDDALETWSDWG